MREPTPSQKRLNEMANELRVTLLALAEQWKVSERIALERLKRWEAERAISFTEEEGGILNIKKISLPATTSQPSERILIKKEESPPQPKPPPAEKRTPSPPKVKEPSIPLYFPPPTIKKEIIPSQPEASPSPSPSNSSQTIVEEKEEIKPLPSWTFYGRATSLILFAIAFGTISVSILINAWFGSELCQLPQAKPLCIAAGVSFDLGKFTLLAVAGGLLARRNYFASIAAFAMWFLCLLIGLTAVLGFIAANQDNFVTTKKVIVDSQEVTRRTIKDMSEQIDDLNEEEDKAKRKKDRAEIQEKIADLVEKRAELNKSLRKDAAVSHENPVAKFIMTAVNWITASFLNVQIEDVNFARAWLFALCIELLPPIALFGAPLFWWNERRHVSGKKRPV